MAALVPRLCTNTHIMATGSTGLGEIGRETQRTFSVNSEVKLAFGDGLLASTPSSTAESGDAGGTAGSAQAVSLTSLSNVDRDAANITGSISSSGDFDYFSINLMAGTTLTADINNEVLGVSAADTILSVFDTDGISLLGSNDDTHYSTSTFGAGTLRSWDSILFNIPILTSGTYYVKVRGYGSDAGNYELLLHSDTVVPEPASWLIFMGLVGTATVMRRRRRETRRP